MAFTDPILALEHFVLNQRDYYLLISDYRMPGMNGLEFLQKVKETDSAVRLMLKMMGYSRIVVVWINFCKSP